MEISTRELSRKFFERGKPSARGTYCLQKAIRSAINKSENYEVRVRTAKNGGREPVESTLTVCRNERNYLVLTVGKDQISIMLPVEEERYLARNIRTMETAIVQIFTTYPLSQWVRVEGEASGKKKR